MSKLRLKEKVVLVVLLIGITILIESQYAFIFPYLIGRDSSVIRLLLLGIGFLLVAPMILLIVKGEYFTQKMSNNEDLYNEPVHYKRDEKKKSS